MSKWRAFLKSNQSAPMEQGLAQLLLRVRIISKGLLKILIMYTLPSVSLARNFCLKDFNRSKGMRKWTFPCSSVSSMSFTCFQISPILSYSSHLEAFENNLKLNCSVVMKYDWEHSLEKPSKHSWKQVNSQLWKAEML